MFFPLQVCHRRGLQISPKKRMERQELILMGVLTLQQQLYGAPWRQGDAGGGKPAAEAVGCPAGLWQQFTVLLWCHELPAHSHLWSLLPSACCTHFHDLEQVGHDPLRATCSWFCRCCGLRSSRAATAADGPLPTRVTVLDRNEDLPLRKVQQWPSRVHSGPVTERLIGNWITLSVWLSSPLHKEWTSCFLMNLEGVGDMHTSLEKCQSC